MADLGSIFKGDGWHVFGVGFFVEALGLVHFEIRHTVPWIDGSIVRMDYEYDNQEILQTYCATAAPHWALSNVD